jgi:phosphate transport system permease protein
MSADLQTRPLAPGPEPLATRPRLGRKVLWASVVWSALIGILGALLLGRGPVVAVLLSVLALAVSLPALSARIEGARRAKDRFVTIVVSIAFSLAMLPLVSVLWTVITNGITRFDGTFFGSDMRGVLGEGGGALHAIVGTLLVTGGAAAISIPVGIMTAVYLVEYGRGPLARAVTLLVDVMTGIPSIVAGLFAFAFFALFLGPSVRFGIGGAVALSVLMIPVVVRSVEEMLKLVPNELREASYALGVPQWRTIVKVVLPTAAAGIAAGVTLAIARVIGETAPLLIIAGATTAVNGNLFDGRMMTLPVFTYSSYTIPGVPPEFGIDRAWAAALTLFVIVMALNLVARLIARFFGNPTGR